MEKIIINDNIEKHLNDENVKGALQALALGWVDEKIIPINLNALGAVFNLNLEQSKLVFELFEEIKILNKQ